MIAFFRNKVIFMGIHEYIKEFLEYCEIAQNKSLKTIENYKHYLKRFDDFLSENIRPKDLTLKKIQNYRVFLNRVTDEKGRKLSTKTQNYHLISLRAFLKYLVKNDVETMAPEKIELGKIPERTVEFLTREELDRLFEAVDKTKSVGLRNTAILETLYSTGLRVSELRSLNREQVDLKRREFMVRGKGKKPRIVFLSKKATEAIENYIKKRDDNFKPLFINSGKGMKADIIDAEKRRLTTVSIENVVRK
ncbi:MAG: tyrosine-type recombinase/integrase, partial [Candidatus Gracilibacteria bacterium]|nr:tyrosine-type recombinase/integrase [Candidatus Gracilibacteria bacterium]